MQSMPGAVCGRAATFSRGHIVLVFGPTAALPIVRMTQTLTPDLMKHE
jgi:hypothetical protein